MPDLKKNGSHSKLFEIIAAAVLYFLVGKLGLIWAIPPGFASMVWLSSGIALLAVILYGRHTLLGIFAGSFCVNFFRSSAPPFFDPSLTHVFVSTSIGIGAAAEALVASILLRDTLARLRSSDSDLLIPKFFLYAGPVSCMISPVIGCAALFTAGLISKADLLANMINWWIGDSIGAMVLAPFLFIFDSKTKSIVWQRFNALFWPVCICFTAAIAIFTHTKKIEEKKFLDNLTPQYEAIISTFERNIIRYKDLLLFSKSLFTVNEMPTRIEFRKHTRFMFDRYPGLIGMSWIPVIPDNQRGSWEKLARDDGYLDFQFQESINVAERHTAPKRDYYHVIFYNENLDLNKATIGFNLFSEANRLPAMNLAETSKTIAPTGLLSLVSGGGRRLGSVMYLAIMQGEMKHDLLSQNNAPVMAFVSLALQTDAVIQGTIGHLLSNDFEMTIVEKSESAVSKIFEWGAPLEENPINTFEVVKEVEGITASPWTFSFSPTRDFLQSNGTYLPWYFLIAGMIGTCATAGVILSLVRKNEAVQTEILVRREAENTLAVINQDLIKREHELEITKKAAEDANKAKDVFLANMSHEIRTPLSAVLGFSELLATSRSPEELLRYRDTIRRNGKLLNSIISDILDVSTIEAGKFSILITEANLQEIISDVETIFRPDAKAKGLTLTVHVDEDVPKIISTDANRLRQILINIIGNALKFTSQGSVTVNIKIIHETKKMLAIEVTDTGPGINPEKSSLLFKPFNQLDESITRMHGGSGLGLALSRWLARYLGGDLILKSTGIASGCCFSITIDHEKKRT